MKKYLLVLLFISIFVFAHSQESQSPKKNNFDFCVNSIVAVSDDQMGFGPGLSVDWYNTELFGPFGMGAFLNIVFPYVQDRWGVTASLLTGPSYMIFNNGKFALPVTAGVHFDVVAPINFSVMKINLGIGANFDFVWLFGEKWHAYARILAAYNFGAGGEFLAFPGLGIGFSF